MTLPMKVRGASRLVALALCCALAACASATDAPVYPAGTQTPVASAPPRVVTLYIPTPAPVSDEKPGPLAYYTWAQTAAPDELYADHLRLSSPGPDANPLVDKVHLGILMSISGIASADSEREAIAVLKSIDTASADEANRDYTAFAAFLLSHLEQRAALRAATSDVVTSREALEELQSSNAQLQQKLDALTKLEEQLVEREQAQREQ